VNKVSRRDFIIKAPAAAATAAYIGATESDAETSPSRSAEGSHPASDAPSDQTLDTRQVFSSSIRDTYEGDYLERVAFPMGGIGAGCISLSGTGKLIDWEIFNNPNRGYQPYYSFLSVFAQEDGGKPAFRVLEGQLRGSFEGPLYVTKDMWHTQLLL
jgi:hypothetical protein